MARYSKETKMNNEYADKIRAVCFGHYNRNLMKNGKATKRDEWTVMSAVVMGHREPASYEVVSMGTGTKCIGEGSMCPRGLIVNDSHSEVIARRSFVCFLYEEIEKSITGGSSVFTVGNDGRCCLQPGIGFHFFTTHVPCGDASIIEKSSFDCLEENVGCRVNDDSKISDDPHLKKHLILNDESKPSKRFKLDEIEVKKTKPAAASKEELEPCENFNSKYINLFCDVSKENDKNDAATGDDALDLHRTGAKCVTLGDPQLPGLNYHIVGVLRTKPGRGDRTISLSCSDKICKWNVLGLQGAILMHFLNSPVYLDSFIICSNMFCEKAFCRATYERVCDVSFLPGKFTPHKPLVHHLKEDLFESRREPHLKQMPCASG